INSYFKRDPAIKSKLEVILCYPGFHAIILYRLTHFLWNKKVYLIARMLSQFARFLTGIEIHPAAQIGKNLFIDHGIGVVIGETAKIGDNVTLYHGVTLGGTSWNKGVRHPQLEDNIIIGAGAQLLGPIKVKSNAKIGSNAVVTKDVDENSTMIGIPARSLNKYQAQYNKSLDGDSSNDSNNSDNADDNVKNNNDHADSKKEDGTIQDKDQTNINNETNDNITDKSQDAISNDNITENDADKFSAYAANDEIIDPNRRDIEILRAEIEQIKEILKIK
ncbi:MAG: serine O-acetyltransferase, partial [Pseudomonadota bacterium]